MIILTGGKTGGHIIPLIALYEYLGSVMYVGCKDGLEERLCKEYKIPFKGLIIKNNPINLIKNSYNLKMNNVKCIISTGGFVSVPALLYGLRHKIPIYLIEGNVEMGSTNKLFSLVSKKVFFAYKQDEMKNKYKLTGLPMLNIKDNNIKDNFDILIIGGSLGSKPLCDLVYSLNKDYKIILIAGRYYKDYNNIKNVKVYEYFNELTGLMSKSKLIISRAGAMTTYEIFKINKPCIIIPSKTTKNNHQYTNAKYFEKNNLCLYLDEEEAINTINNTVSKLLSSDALMVNMKNKQAKITNLDSIKLIMEEINEFH